METFAETLTAGEKSAALAGAIGASMITVVIMTGIALWILTIIASWKVLQKAGEPGWKAIIPIYNVYMLYKIVGMSNWFWGLLAASFIFGIITTIDGTAQIMNYTDSAQYASVDWSKHVLTVIAMLAYMAFAIVAEVVYANRTAKAFGHGVGFAVGLFFLQPIFWLILGFDRSKYNKKVALGKSSR